MKRADKNERGIYDRPIKRKLRVEMEIKCHQVRIRNYMDNAHPSSQGGTRQGCPVQAQDGKQCVGTERVRVTSAVDRPVGLKQLGTQVLTVFEIETMDNLGLLQTLSVFFQGYSCFDIS